MNWKGKKILVTGAGGFIGSHLAEILIEKGAEVRAFVHYNSRNDWGDLEFLASDKKEKIEVICGDIRDPFFVKTAVKDCEVVFHLAALIAIPYSYSAPKDFFDTNVNGTLNVMQASLENGVKKIVHTSTSEVYGTARYTPINEEHPLQAQSPYSASKIGADKIAESFYNSFDLPVATIRPFNTYGPRQSARAVIPAIMCQVVAGKRQILTGLLSPVRDLTYVSDTVNGFLKIAESNASIGEVINVGYGKGVTIREVAEMIIKLNGTDAEIVQDKQRLRPEKSEVMKLVCDNNKAKKLAGWEPKFTLEDGLKDMMGYMRANLEKYKPTIYNV